MRQTSLQFKNAIRSRAREIDTRVIFYIDSNKYVIKGKDVQSIKYNASVERELGGIEKKIATITLIKNVITDKLNKGAIIFRETWVKYNGSWISDFQEELTVVSRKISDSASTIKIEAVDNLTIKREEVIPSIPQQMNIDLRTYFVQLLSGLTKTYTLDENLVNPTLDLAFAKSSNVHETLLEMAIASQGLVKTDFTVRKFVKGTVVDKLDYGTGLLDVKIDDDDSDSYERVDVSVFSPTSRLFRQLGGLHATIPPSARQYKLGSIGFDKLYIPQLIIFSNQVIIDDYKISSSGCDLIISTTENAAINLDVEFWGLDVNSVRKTASDKENKTKIISNVYIQSPTIYNTDIYKGKAATVKYIGNTSYEVGDCIRVDNKYDVFILEHDLTYDGALRGVIKGVVM